MKSVCVLAILAAASTAAVAKDLKQDQKAPAPTVKATMSDAEMDKVTAGAASVSTPGPNVDVSLPDQGLNAFNANSVGNSHSHNGNAANLHGQVGF